MGLRVMHSYEFYIPSRAQLQAVFTPSSHLGEAQFNRLLDTFSTELQRNPQTSDIVFGQPMWLTEKSIASAKRALIYAGTCAYGNRQADTFKNIFLFAGLRAPHHLFPEIVALSKNDAGRPQNMRIQWRIPAVSQLTA